MKEKILYDLRRMQRSRFEGKTDMEIYNFICDIFFLKDGEYSIARECATIIYREINNL